MRSTYRFAKHREVARCQLTSGERIEVPVIPGILKHPHPDQLGELLTNPRVAEKYTKEALRKAAWPILSQFPRAWLRRCMDGASLPPTRRKAIAFLLS